MPREAVFMTYMEKNERSRFTGPGYETMRKLAEASILALLLIATGSSIGIAQTGHRLGISHASSLYSNKEKFEFSIGSERIVLSSANPVVYFSKTFSVGESYRITQISGPRTCAFADAKEGTLGNQDIVLAANCGYPPLSIFKLAITGIEPGESFKFADNYGRTLTAPFSTTANLGGFPRGDDYQIQQTGGPRQCRMLLSAGVVSAEPVTVKADCSKGASGGVSTPPATGAGTNAFPQFDMVTRSSDDKVFGTFYDTFTPVIGGKGADEGRYVAFVTYAKNLGGSGKYRQVVWRDRKTGETRLVSQANGVEGNQNSTAPAISADGRSVAFESYATNLTPDSNNVRDVFVWNADTNTVTAVSENRGVEANAEAFEPTISGDGNLIAFSSSADTLAPGVTGTSTVNVYLRDMRSGAVTLISKAEKDGKGGGGSRPSISEDGSRIAFQNYFPLTKEDKNSLWDIYVWQSGRLKRISKTSAGGDKDQGDESASRVVSPSISGDGRFVAFATTATNMVADDTNKLQDVFVVEVDSGRVTRASTGEASFQGDGDSPVTQGEKIAISYDGRWVTFSSKAKNLGGNILLKDLQSNRLIKVSADVASTVGPPSISVNGATVLFGSSLRLDERFQSSGIFAVHVGGK